MVGDAEKKKKVERKGKKRSLAHIFSGCDREKGRKCRPRPKGTKMAVFSLCPTGKSTRMIFVAAGRGKKTKRRGQLLFLPAMRPIAIIAGEEEG